MPALRANPPQLPDWPRHEAAPAYLQDAIQRRLQSVYELAKSEIRTGSWWKDGLMNLYLWLGWRLYLRGALCEAALDAVKTGLGDQGLLPKPLSSPST